MKNNTLENHVQEAASQKPGKAPYSSPELRIFGRVADLTRGGGGSGVDCQKQSGANPNHPVFGGC
jgi:hypothetical protein